MNMKNSSIAVAVVSMVLLSAVATPALAALTGADFSDRGLEYQTEHTGGVDTANVSLAGAAAHLSSPSSGDDRIKLRTSSGGGGQLIYDAGVPNNESWAVEQKMRFGTGTTQSVRFYADGINSFSNGYEVRFNADGSVSLESFSGGTKTQLATASSNLNSDGNWNASVEYQEGTVTAYVEDTEVLTHTISSPDTTYQNLGWAGFGSAAVHTDSNAVYGAEPNSAPSVTIDAPADGATVPTGDSVSYNASASDSDGSISSVEWDFDGDGATDATGENVSYTHSSDGSHTVEVTVTDDDGATVTQTITVTADSDVETVSSPSSTCEEDSTTTADSNTPSFLDSLFDSLFGDDEDSTADSDCDSTTDSDTTTDSSSDESPSFLSDLFDSLFGDESAA